MPLRWRLTLWHLGLMALGLLGFIWISYRVLSDSLRAEIDRTLAERANHVADAVAVVPNRPIEGISPEATDEFSSPGVYVQLFNAEGVRVAHSFNLGTQELPVTVTDLNRMLTGDTFYLTSQVEAQPVRLYHQPLKRGSAIVGAVQVGQSLTALETTLNRIRLIYTVGAAVVLLFGLVGGWGLARLGLRPVTRLTQTARDIVRAEDLARRVMYSGPADELGTLATTFNDMLDRLQTLFEGQRRFLAEAAHELRTPLASMLGNLDLLARFGDDPERRREALAALQRTGRHTARLLDDLLLLAQAEAGWHLRQLGPVAVDDIFLEACETAQLTAKGVAVQVETCEPACVLGDADRLRQVFANLIDNAMKYSPPDGMVLLELWPAGQTVYACVSNTGPGIPPEALPYIFEPFFRASSRERSGAGLGLVIARWIAREHGGDITVENFPGQGVQVTLTLPVYVPSPTPQESH